MSNALVPEIAVTDWRVSRHFYCEILGFKIEYERPDEGFSYLSLGQAELMIDQIGVGRDFDEGHLPRRHPFGKGVNLQIRTEGVADLCNALTLNGISLFLPLEDRWYRVGAREAGNRQFVVADPDGYLLRFYEEIGVRDLTAT